MRNHWVVNGGRVALIVLLGTLLTRVAMDAHAGARPVGAGAAAIDAIARGDGRSVSSYDTFARIPNTLADGQLVYMAHRQYSFDTGGGLFTYDADMPKSKANGGTLYDTGQTLDNQGKGTGNGCLIRDFHGPLNVTWFGAVTIGHGVKPPIDCGIPIQKALVAAATDMNDGWNPRPKAVFIPAGSYMVHTPIKLTHRAHVFGEGPYSTTLYVNTDIAVFYSPGSEKVSGLHLRDFGLWGKSSDSFSNTAIDLHGSVKNETVKSGKPASRGATYSRFENLRLEHFHTGIFIEHAWTCHFVDIAMSTMSYAGIVIGARCNIQVITQCQIINAKHLIICDRRESTARGGNGSTGCSTLFITNNDLANNNRWKDGWAIKLREVETVCIGDNWMEEMSGGIYADNVANMTIRGNRWNEIHRYLRLSRSSAHNTYHGDTCIFNEQIHTQVTQKNQHHLIEDLTSGFSSHRRDRYKLWNVTVLNKKGGTVILPPVEHYQMGDVPFQEPRGARSVEAAEVR